jgi:hypothetical protein
MNTKTTPKNLFKKNKIVKKNKIIMKRKRKEKLILIDDLKSKAKNNNEI